MTLKDLAGGLQETLHNTSQCNNHGLYVTNLNFLSVFYIVALS